mgnify:CR=1 FL=1|jgi:hypothetical protein
MARRRMQISNRKAQAQRREVLFMQKERRKQMEHSERGLFSNTTISRPNTPTEFKEYVSDSGYRRETHDYPSNTAIGGSTGAPERFYANSSTITIGQAYNKGNLVVLTNDESRDPSTGKRR